MHSNLRSRKQSLWGLLCLCLTSVTVQAQDAPAYLPEIRFHLTAQGQLDEAFQTESRFPDARVEQCLLRAARQLSFPRPQGGDIRFAVPLRLSTDRAPSP